MSTFQGLHPWLLTCALAGLGEPWIFHPLSIVTPPHFRSPGRAQVVSRGWNPWKTPMRHVST
jgi:hypothetical protein